MSSKRKDVTEKTGLVLALGGGGAPAGVAHIAAPMERVMRGPPCPLLMLPPGAGIRPPFVVIYDGSPASARALLLAVQLAQAEDAAVTVLLAASEPPAVRRLRAEADALLAGTKLIAHYPALPRADATAMARAVRAAAAGTLLMAADSAAFNGNARRRLLEELECAALLTR